MRERLVLENELVLRKAMLEVATPREGQFHSNEDAVTCILHMEIRVCEMLVGMIAQHGMSEAIRDVVGGQAVLTAQKEYLWALNETIQTEILQTKNRRSGWKIRLAEKDGDQETAAIKKLSVKKSQAKNLIGKARILLEACFPGNQNKVSSLSAALEHYNSALLILKKREDYTNEEIDDFQNHIDKWYHIWINEFGYSTYSNYIHVLHTGHMAEEMKRFRCLYRYSQEGLEAMNALMKSFWFRRSSRGGGKGEAADNRIIPIGRWCQRRLCWMHMVMAERELSKGDVVEGDGVELPISHSIRRDLEKLRPKIGNKAAETREVEETIDEVVEILFDDDSDYEDSDYEDGEGEDSEDSDSEDEGSSEDEDNDEDDDEAVD